MQTWFNLTTIGKFSTKKPVSKFRYWLEGQERIGDDTRHFTQTLLRPGVGYAINENLSLWLGYAWVSTSYPLTKDPHKENRIWQQLLWAKQYQYLRFTSRTRVEERLLENDPKTAYRLRQLLKVSIPLISYPNFSFVSSDEVFWHTNDFKGVNGNGFDQNRFFVGLGHLFTSKGVVEIGYMNQYIRRFDTPNFLANIVSINFYLNL